MALDARRKQKAAQKRKQREKRVREQKARRAEADMGGGKRGGLGRSASYPIVECVISKDWQERGVAHILVARRMDDGNLLVGGYYVDPWCVGLKDCATMPGVEEDEYQQNVKNNIFNDDVEFVDFPAERARALIEGAVEYAVALGFKPNKRWNEARQVLNGIEADTTDLTFGKDGKPCLVMRQGENLKGALARLQRNLDASEFTVEEAAP